jgi:hypothetical protein
MNYTLLSKVSYTGNQKCSYGVNAHNLPAVEQYYPDSG